MNISKFNKDMVNELHRNVLQRSEVLINLLINYFKEFNKKDYEFFFNKYHKYDIESFTVHTRLLCTNLINLLKNTALRPYLNIRMHNENLISKLDKITSFLALNKTLNVNDEIYERFFNFFHSEISSFSIWLENYTSFLIDTMESNEKIIELELKYQEALAHIHKTNSQKTEELYTIVSDEYIKRAHSYEALFYLIFLGAFLFTVVHLNFVDYQDNKINYIFVKVMTITFVITLGTIFLRKAAHLRKLNDQAHQTSLELKALPLFLKNVDPEHHSEIYKELAGKYFGKELDQTQNDKIGDLMKDQLAAGTELIKASAELVKAKGSSTPPT